MFALSKKTVKTGHISDTFKYTGYKPKRICWIIEYIYNSWLWKTCIIAGVKHIVDDT